MTLGGSETGDAHSEGEVGRDYLVGGGVPESSIIADRNRFFALERIDARRAEDRQLLGLLEAMMRRVGDPLRSTGAEEHDQPG